MPAARKAYGITPVSLLVAALLGACGQSEKGDPAGSESVPRVRVAAKDPSRAPAKAQPQPRGYRAFVAIEDEDRVAVLDGPPWRGVRSVSVPSGPHNATAHPAGRYVAVSSPPAGRVTLLDARGRVKARATAGPGAHDLAFTPSGRRLWVSAEGSGRVVKLTVPGGRPVASRATAGPPHDLAVSPDGRELWVTIDGSSAVEVRSAGNGELLARPRLGPAPHDVAIEPGGRRIWFSNVASPLLTVASARSREPLTRLRAGGEPHHFEFGAGGLWASDNSGGELLRIGPRSRRVRASTPVGPAPHHVAVAGRDVLVAVHELGRLAVVSGGGQLRRRVEVGAGPHGVAALRR
jgi:DNA-binding beta-propeller fold protein YncE